MKSPWLIWHGLVLLTLLGCEASPDAAPSQRTGQPSAGAAPPAPPSSAAIRGEAEQLSANSPEVNGGEVAGDLVPATAGVGRQGQGYGGGLITEPIRQRFLIEQKLVFDVQIKQALALYKAQSPQGRGPATHDEFMQKIIQANRIQLPELPAGERYLYDPAAEQLMVQRPAAAGELTPANE